MRRRCLASSPLRCAVLHRRCCESVARRAVATSAPRVDHTEGPIVCSTIAEAHVRAQQLWDREMAARARDYSRHERTCGSRASPPQKPCHDSDDTTTTTTTTITTLSMSPALYLARTTLCGLHAWWSDCESCVLLPHDVLHACHDAAGFVLELIRHSTAARGGAQTSSSSSSSSGWRSRFQRLSDDAILDEFDEWLLLHAPPPSISPPPPSSSSALLSGPHTLESDAHTPVTTAFLSFPRFLALVESYLRYHEGVVWGPDPPSDTSKKALAAYYRRRYRLHPWADQHCPEGREAQMPFVHLLQWMLARDEADGATAGTDLWRRFRALEPFYPRTTASRADSHGFAALDVGCQSGFATDLLLTAGASYVLAVDTTQLALNSTEATVHDHVQRVKGAHGRELAAQHQQVQVQQCALLPAPPVDTHVVAATTTPTSTAATATATATAAVNTFQSAAQRRREQARAQGSQYGQATVQPATAAAGLRTAHVRGDGKASFDVVYYHPASPSVWPAATLSEMRHGHVGELPMRASAWWDDVVRVQAALDTTTAMDPATASHKGERTTPELPLPWVLSPVGHALNWCAVPAFDPLAPRRAAARATASTSTATAVQQLIEQLTLDVVQRSAGVAREDVAKLSSSPSRGYEGEPHTGRAVVHTERPLVRDDGYVVLVLPRAVDAEAMAHVLFDAQPGRPIGATPSPPPPVSLADSVLMALDGLYDPVLRREYGTGGGAARHAETAEDAARTAAPSQLPRLAQRALASIGQTPSAIAAAAQLLRRTETLSQTTDVLVLRKNPEACARARAAVAALAAQRVRSGDAETAALRHAFAAYERLTRNTNAKNTSQARADGDDDDGDGDGGGVASSSVSWRDSFEYNEMKPRSTATTRYHWTDLVPSYSYLEPDFYEQGGRSRGDDRDRDRVAVRDVTNNFLAVGHPQTLSSAHDVDAQDDPQAMIASAARYGMEMASSSSSASSARSSDMDSSTSRRAATGSRGGDSQRVASVAKASHAFRAIFAEELRQKRRGKMRKLALSPIEQQEWYVDKKLLNSGAAKVDLMNELARWDLKDYD